MMQFRKLTNVRPTKELGTQVVVSPTMGQFKVTPLAAKLIGVTAGSYLAIVMDEADNAYAVKGAEGDGGKLAAGNKNGGGSLTLSAANAWEELGGDKDFNIHCDISAETSVSVAATDEEGNEIEGAEPTVYFLLTEVERTAKQVRKKKEVAEGDNEVAEGNGNGEAKEPIADAEANFEEM